MQETANARFIFGHYLTSPLTPTKFRALGPLLSYFDSLSGCLLSDVFVYYSTIRAHLPRSGGQEMSIVAPGIIVHARTVYSRYEETLPMCAI